MRVNNSAIPLAAIGLLLLFGSVAHSEAGNTKPASDPVGVEAVTSGMALATSSFIPPEGCVEDEKLAAMLGAVQACIQRFSKTHEFVVALLESRLINTRQNAVANEKIAARAVDEHIAELMAANQSQRGITIGNFDVVEVLPKGRPTGANYCKTIYSTVSDRRVPGYQGEEFRIWGQTLICARADLSDNSVQVVELRCSERFRVKTDMVKVKDRFAYLMPVVSAMKAEESLKMY